MEITKLKGVDKEIDSNFNNIIPESQSNDMFKMEVQTLLP